MTKNIISFISSLFFILLANIIRIIPFRVLYGISDILAWLLCKIFRYRYDVVMKNISQTDLQLSKNQKEKLIREIYRNLSDILLEGIKSFSMNRSTVIKRHKLVNPEILNPYYKDGRSIILVTGHIGNWEWGSLSAGLQTPYRIVGFYTPLKNKFINHFIGKSRSKYGTVLAPIRQTSQSFIDNKDKPSMFLMAADQSPSKLTLPNAYWIKFLGRQTAFLHGPEKHAKNNDYPVVFTEIKRVKRGYYELYLSVLTEKPTEYDSGGLTEIYVQKLETVIREYPANWLWTHRRWKHKPPNEKSHPESLTL
jgi:Kdo2-lipid IVA lauroyltransferase/acyltransferase